MAKNQITGGAFQDFEGNPLSYGYLTMQLSHDEQESTDPGQVVGGYPLIVPLDTNGNISGTVSVWPNDQLNPAGSFYIVNAFRRDGRIAWLSPQQFTITSSPSPFNLGTAVPVSASPVGAAVGALLLQTNGVNNASQSLLNIINGTNITAVNSGGGVTISAAGGGGNFTTSGQGWFAGPGMTDASSCFMNSATEPITNFAANTVVVFQFVLQAAWALSACSYELTAVATAGNTFNFGIYNAAGSKLIDASFNGNTSSLQTITFGPTTIGPGVFYFAASTTDSGSATGPAAQPGSVSLQMLAGFNATTVKIGTAANAASGGSLPATLGTLTAATVIHWQSIPLPIWSV